MDFVLLRPGTFIQGTPPEEPHREEQETPHRVTLRDGLFMGRTEVTQRQWRAVMGGNPSHHAGCDACPVETVSFADAQAFALRLGRLSGHRFRLPSEAEWEYACRAGATTAFAGGDRLTTDSANVDGRVPYTGRPVGGFRGHPVGAGTLPSNAWGLHEMHGNVWEWTADPHCPYPSGPVTDPAPACGSPYNVIRGGSYLFGADSARCGLRYTHRPQDTGPSLGFRLVREP